MTMTVCRADMTVELERLPESLASLRSDPAMQDAAVKLRLLSSSEQPLPTDAEIEDLLACGVTEVDMARPVHLGGDDAWATVEFVRFLRDCFSHGLPVRWQAEFLGGFEEAKGELVHLPPPGQPASSWSTQHAYGQFYWRSGPGFIAVRDTRPGRPAARYTIDDPHARALFARLASPTPAAECVGGDPASEAILADFIDEHIVLALGKWVVGLPIRMRRWPIPYMAI